jgi:hypothetical protein
MRSGLPVTSRRHITYIASALSVLGGVCGCADSEITAPETSAEPAPATLTTGSATDGQPKLQEADIEVTPTAHLGAPPAPGPSDDSAEGQAEAYSPPFPDRVDLFVAPKRQGGGRSQDSSERAVELMGFIRVDRARAILSINGQVSPIAEGESVDGIEVISVQPPSVLLQRGRQRWQATIE